MKPESDPMSSGADVVSSTVTVSTMLSGTILAGYRTAGVTVMYQEGVSVEIAMTLLARVNRYGHSRVAVRNGLPP